MHPTAIITALALLALTLVPAATAAGATEDTGTRPCVLMPRTLVWHEEPDAEAALRDTLEPCTGFGITPAEPHMPQPYLDDVGGLKVHAGDDTKIGVQHEQGLGGSVYFQRTGHSIELHWTQGIRHCWIEVPTDGTVSPVGPHCVY